MHGTDMIPVVWFRLYNLTTYSYDNRDVVRRSVGVSWIGHQTPVETYRTHTEHRQLRLRLLMLYSGYPENREHCCSCCVAAVAVVVATKKKRGQYFEKKRKNEKERTWFVRQSRLHSLSSNEHPLFLRCVYENSGICCVYSLYIIEYWRSPPPPPPPSLLPMDHITCRW